MKKRARQRRENERRWAAAELWAHAAWLLLGACNRYEEGHDVNCRCHNGSPVLLDTRRPSPAGGDPK